MAGVEFECAMIGVSGGVSGDASGGADAAYAAADDSPWQIIERLIEEFVNEPSRAA